MANPFRFTTAFAGCRVGTTRIVWIWPVGSSSTEPISNPASRFSVGDEGCVNDKVDAVGRARMLPIWKRGVNWTAITSIPRPRTTELPLAAARLPLVGCGCGTIGGGGAGAAGFGWEAGAATATGGGGSGGGAGAAIGGGAGECGALSLAAVAPFGFAGFSPFPCRTIAPVGSGPFASVSLTSATSASDTKGLAIVATTLRYFRAVAAISDT